MESTDAIESALGVRDGRIGFSIGETTRAAR
jgi:hypothetical protein